MRAVFLRPRDKKVAKNTAEMCFSKNTAKMALLATAALATPPVYAVTPSPLTVVYTAPRRLWSRIAPSMSSVHLECRWRKFYP